MGSGDTGQEKSFELVYSEVAAWVDDYFVRVFGDALGYRPDDQLNWCPEWWRHPSAAIRLDALWRVWERHRLEGGLGISLWFLDHADPHLRALTDGNGPFRRCSIEHGHQETSPLPTAGLPAHDVFGDPSRELFRDPSREPGPGLGDAGDPSFGPR